MTIFWTTFATVLSGVLIFSLGQILQKFLFEPIVSLKNVISEINHSLIYDANVFCNPGPDQIEKRKEVSELLRRQASLLISKSGLIPWYWFWERLNIIVKRDNIIIAHRELIGLSNSVFDGNPTVTVTKRDKIAELLKIDLGET